MKWGFEECVSLGEGKFYSRKELQCEQRLRGGNECILPAWPPSFAYQPFSKQIFVTLAMC